MAKQFEFSDEDIEAAQRYMRLHISKDATREDAEAMLKRKRSELRKIARDDPKRLHKLQKRLDADKP